MEIRPRTPIDDELVRRLAPLSGDVVVDLGCGPGRTLERAAEAAPGARLVGLDWDAGELQAAGQVLAGAPAAWLLVRADLAGPLPLATASASRIVCHNVLGDVPDPAALLEEASRVLRPGGTSVWSYTDFESVAISGGDDALTRRIVQTYADTPGIDPCCDGRMGRRLPALVASCPLRRTAVGTSVVLSTSLAGLALVRIRTMVATLRDAGAVAPDDLAAWRASLEAADQDGRFLYAHTTYVVEAERP
ncbi:MAG: methyltransferase domain-containing protein [Acidimicrobiales bacterium]